MRLQFRGACSRRGNAGDGHASRPYATSTFAGALRAPRRTGFQAARQSRRPGARHASKGLAVGHPGSNASNGGARRDNDDDDDDNDEEDLDAKLDARSLGPVAGARVRGAAVHADVDAVVSRVGRSRSEREGGRGEKIESDQFCRQLRHSATRRLR